MSRTVRFYRITPEGVIPFAIHEDVGSFSFCYFNFPDDTVQTTYDSKTGHVSFCRMRVEARAIVVDKVYSLTKGQTLLVQKDGTIQVVPLDMVETMVDFLGRETADDTSFGMRLPFLFLHRGMNGVLEAIKSHIRREF